MATTKTETSPKMVTIRLPRLPGAHTDQRKFVAVNGEAYMIERGKEVEVPDYIAKCLEEAQIQNELAEEMISGRAE